MQEQNNIIHGLPIDLPAMKGLGHLYFQRMQEHHNNIALTHAETGEQHTYGLVLQKAVRTAIAMKGKGVKPKDIISICSTNGMDNMIPYYAALFIGAISANLDPNLPLVDTIHLLKQVKPKLLFTASNTIKTIKDALKEVNCECEIVVFGGNFTTFLEQSSEEENFRPIEIEDLRETANIVFTSGSTGMPKGACLTHLGLFGVNYIPTPLKPETTVLVCSNLYWISSLAVTAPITMWGHNKIVYPKLEYETVWDVIDKYQVNIIVTNSHQIIGIIESKPKKYENTSVQVVVFGGHKLSEDMIKNIRRKLPNTYVSYGYGQTEMNGVILSLEGKFYATKPSSAGQARPGCSYKIVDLDTDESLGPNKEGELRIKTDFVMNGYYGIDSSDMWDDNGFFKTGDIAYYDEEECFYIVDRAKDLMKYQMWHISPAKIELEFYQHAAVAECVVTGRTHPLDGDLLLGLVVLKEKYEGKVSEQEIQDFVNGRLGPQFKLRGGVKFIKEIPKTVTEKVSRIKIKQMVRKGLF